MYLSNEQDSLVAAAVNMSGIVDFLKSAASALALAGGSAAVVFFIIGAIQLNGSTINPMMAERGKTNMIHAVFSALLCGGAVYILNTFLGGFGLPTIGQ
ncbi:MAG TPA: hypothetical protein VH186_36055 [Chloroflexia bacterium]|nr:hypothetical protein [Chloroflexia bacterium]